MITSPRTVFRPFTLAGFTLVEVMVTIAIVAILTAVALPTYRNYIVKSHVKGAGADLVALALVMENQHQLTLTYPTGSNLGTSSSTNTTNFTAFGPAESAMFAYSASVTAGSTTAYTLTAAGRSGQVVSGCTLTLNNTNARTISVAGSQACGGLSSW
ncbi:type IV pilin protein [Silvimonas iriomotensis]|uniref:Prepilin-type N-terminal cleavage/methylation domain-containing protein n=1 Tax=Silvimonas iriomotensis TaxID=449662 RepID=A0ABQ2P7T3_9NEIS|nr:type IV pilin protein [Silvimonas iriomotensis]GGP20472.1 prepilin-type N-terminal cleavage/methylation domain-containing protein [Silvimonas iriomotensis]